MLRTYFGLRVQSSDASSAFFAFFEEVMREKRESKKTQSKSRAYHDPDYESRIQAALAYGVREPQAFSNLISFEPSLRQMTQ